jgi:hypothetical protein
VQDRRSGEHQEGNRTAHGITGQPEKGDRAYSADHQRFARAHGDAPHMRRTKLSDGVAHMIVAAHADTRGADDEVGGIGRSLEGVLHCAPLVANTADHHGNPGGFEQGRRQHGAVDIGHLVRLGWDSCIHQLVPVAQDGHPWALRHGDIGHPARGAHPNIDAA